ncbi:FAD-binding protein [Streptomyces thinghirensis]|nr:FAD-binding protein [Streptomyces thinghirensis]
MNRVYFDASMDAYCVEAGATNWQAATQLYRTSGRALPGGSCYSVGSGGHISGGGYGLLSRQFGLTVDYLYAVEVVTVADGKTPKVTVARKDSGGPCPQGSVVGTHRRGRRQLRRDHAVLVPRSSPAAGPGPAQVGGVEVERPAGKARAVQVPRSQVRAVLRTRAGRHAPPGHARLHLP